MTATPYERKRDSLARKKAGLVAYRCPSKALPETLRVIEIPPEKAEMLARIAKLMRDGKL